MGWYVGTCLWCLGAGIDRMCDNSISFCLNFVVKVCISDVCLLLRRKGLT